MIRNDNYYSTADNSGAINAYYSSLLATIDGPRGRVLQWGGDYSYTYNEYQAGSPLRAQVGRARLRLPFDAEFALSATAGYESNNYSLTQYGGVIYGPGFSWTPTPRTNVYGSWEHRFFSHSYAAGLSHRTRLTQWTLRASRDVTSAPQQLLTVPGITTADLLNSIFQSQIPDPVQRQQFVDNLIRQAGLPQFATAPQTFYINQVYLLDAVSAAVGLIGVRNSLTFGAYWNRTTPVTTSGGLPLPGGLTVGQFTTLGESVTFSHKISGLSSLSLSAQHSDSRSPASAFNAAIKSTQDTYLLTISHQFNPKTSGSIGLRYMTFNSDIANAGKEHAALAAVTHTF
jgi:uncharacterized protein (PEP-CTERM system associated)